MNRLKQLTSLLILLLMAGYGVAQSPTLKDGMQYTEIEQYANARKVFQELVKQMPSPENYYHLGDFYLKAYKADSLTSYIDSAKMYFAEGLVKNPAFPHNHVGMGAVAMFNKNKTEAKQHFDKALALTKSKDPEVLYRVGEAYILFGHYNDPVSAIELLTKAVTKEQSKPEIYLTLGDAYLMKNEGGMANTNYDQALRINKNLAKAYIRSGKVLIRAKNYNDALDLYKKGIEAEPSYSPAYRELGELYFLAGQYEKAIANYKKYIELSDRNPDTRFKYAAFLFLNKDYNQSINELTQLEKELKNPVIHRLLGYSYYETQKYEPGVTNMETFFQKAAAAKILPSDYEYYGRLLLKSGKDTVKAFENMTKAATLDTTKAVGIYSEIADIYYKGKKYGKAAEVYEQAVKANTGKPNGQAILNLGKSYYYDKNNAMADTTFSRLIEVMPDSPTGYLWKARGKVRLDPSSEKYLAQPFYEKYLVQMEISKASPEKFKKDLIEAYSYLGSYYYNGLKDKTKALEMYDKALVIDPNNEYVKKVRGEIAAAK